jgi:hypothetical protein
MTASVLWPERTKQLHIRQDLNASRCRESLHVFGEEMSISGTNDIGVPRKRRA